MKYSLSHSCIALSWTARWKRLRVKVMSLKSTDDKLMKDVHGYVRSNAALRSAVGIGDNGQVTLSPLGMGEHNKNYLLEAGGERFVLRVNVVKQPFHDDQVAYEFAALEELSSSGCTPQPVYLDNSAEALGEGVLVESFCEGDMLDFDHLRPGDLRCAAQIMADLHAIPVGTQTKLHKPVDPLRELFDECVQRFELYRSSAYEDARITRWAQWFLDESEKALQAPCSREDFTHIVNTEPLPSHFLIPADAAREAAGNDEPSGAFCANPGSFVDWERPIVGEVAQDVAFFTTPTVTFWDSEFLFPSSQVEAFVDDYWRAVDGRFERGLFDERFAAWRKMTALRSVMWCCRALITYSGNVKAHTTEKTVRKLPVYLSDDFMQYIADECFPS